MALINMCGNKQRLVSKVNSIYKKSDIYVEPFLGSGVIFENLPENSFNKAYLYDTSEIIIKIFQFTQTVTDEELEKCKVFALDFYNNLELNKNRIGKLEIPVSLEGIFTLICIQVYSFSYFFRWEIIDNMFVALNTFYINSLYAHYITFDDVIANKLSNIKVLRDKLNKVTIEQKSFFDNYTDYIFNDKALCFLDPPYANGNVRYSGGDFTIQDKEKFTEIINNAKCKIIYTDYKNENIGYNFNKIQTRNAANQIVKKINNEKKSEFLYYNYNITKSLF